MSSVNRKRLIELARLPENRSCADCESPDPDWASYTIGIFLCNTCASTHRSLGSHISRIKSLALDNWDRTQVSVMEEVGNARAKAFYEKYLPVYYRRVKQNDPPVLREQWIRAKYERKEFVNPSDSEAGYCKGFMEGHLWKMGKQERKFQRRKFLLTREENTFVLKYFNQSTETKAKAIMRIDEVNATFAPEKIHPNGMQVTYRRDGVTRNIFVYSDDAKVIVDWYTAIRAAKLHSRTVAFPSASPHELALHLTRDYSQEGYLYKTGPRIGDAYRRRYFVLDDRNLMYSDGPLDAHPKGEIFLGERSEGYSVKAGIPCGLKEKGYGFMLLCPERTWLLGADMEEERDMWIRTLNEVIDRPASFKYAGIAWKNNTGGVRKLGPDAQLSRNSDGNDSLGSRNSAGSTVSLTHPKKVKGGLFSSLKD